MVEGRRGKRRRPLLVHNAPSVSSRLKVDAVLLHTTLFCFCSRGGFLIKFPCRGLTTAEPPPSWLLPLHATTFQNVNWQGLTLRSHQEIPKT